MGAVVRSAAIRCPSFLENPCGSAWTGLSQWRIYDLQAEPWSRRSRMVQQIEDLRDEVRCRIGGDLAELANDQNVTRDGWVRCIRAANDFEDAVDIILNEAWIPCSLPQLTGFLICLTDRIRKTRANVGFGRDLALKGGPDLWFCAHMACDFDRLLEMQREVLMDAVVKLTPPAKWAN